MSWIIWRQSLETDERDMLGDDNYDIPGRAYFEDRADDLEWLGHSNAILPRQFAECDEAYTFIASYVRKARRDKRYDIIEDYYYWPREYLQ